MHFWICIQLTWRNVKETSHIPSSSSPSFGFHEEEVYVFKEASYNNSDRFLLDRTFKILSVVLVIQEFHYRASNMKKPLKEILLTHVTWRILMHISYFAQIMLCFCVDLCLKTHWFRFPSRLITLFIPTRHLICVLSISKTGWFTSGKLQHRS